MRTRDKLATELRKVAATASPTNAEKYETFARRAETGEFDDYANTYGNPVTKLETELTAAGFIEFADRVAKGEFDATKEEYDMGCIAIGSVAVAFGCGFYWGWPAAVIVLGVALGFGPLVRQVRQ